MAEAWKKFKRNGENIVTHWSPVNFFALGIWDDERAWGWDRKKLELERGARVGSN
jgi:hypothetical protein